MNRWILSVLFLLVGYALGRLPQVAYLQLVGPSATDISQCPQPQSGTVVICPIHIPSYPPALLLSVDGEKYLPIERKKPGTD